MARGVEKKGKVNRLLQDFVRSQIHQHTKPQQKSTTPSFRVLKNVWELECVPKTLALCALVMIYKKGFSEDCANYRAMSLLNHYHKILSACILNSLFTETDWFLSD